MQISVTLESLSPLDQWFNNMKIKPIGREGIDNKNLILLMSSFIKLVLLNLLSFSYFLNTKTILFEEIQKFMNQ